jgi:hypothetical protein
MKARMLASILLVLGSWAVTAVPVQAQPVAWTQRVVSGPSPREGHKMAYDSARGVTVLFGGWPVGGNSAQTWEWNGTAWTQRVVSGPSPRWQHAMAYDAARGLTVMFGGRTGNYPGDGENGETWEWNGTAWTQRLVSGPSPGPNTRWSTTPPAT